MMTRKGGGVPGKMAMKRRRDGNETSLETINDWLKRAQGSPSDVRLMHVFLENKDQIEILLYNGDTSEKSKSELLAILFGLYSTSDESRLEIRKLMPSDEENFSYFELAIDQYFSNRSESRKKYSELRNRYSNQPAVKNFFKAQLDLFEPEQQPRSASTSWASSSPGAAAAAGATAPAPSANASAAAAAAAAAPAPSASASAAAAAAPAPSTEKTSTPFLNHDAKGLFLGPLDPLDPLHLLDSYSEWTPLYPSPSS